MVRPSAEALMFHPIKRLVLLKESLSVTMQMWLQNLT